MTVIHRKKDPSNFSCLVVYEIPGSTVTQLLYDFWLLFSMHPQKWMWLYHHIHSRSQTTPEDQEYIQYVRSLEAKKTVT